MSAIAPDNLRHGSLKDPSLLAFQERRSDANMKNIFRISQVPSDTQMREILDLLEPDSLQPMFNDVLRALQRGKALEAFDFLDEYCLLSMDGSGYYSSKKVHCEHCLQRTNHRSHHHSGQRIAFSPRRSRALEDRKRNVQYAQEPGLPVRTQLWTWPEESVDDLCDVDDAGLLGRPNARTLLSFVPGHSQESPYSCWYKGRDDRYGTTSVRTSVISSLRRCSSSTKLCCTTWRRSCPLQAVSHKVGQECLESDSLGTASCFHVAPMPCSAQRLRRSARKERPEPTERRDIQIP